jgi:phospholipid-binding lipoprotein MlaA
MVENLVGSMMARLRGSAVAMMAAAVLMGGCASTDTGAAEVWDPMETPNRFMFAINRTVDMIAIRPLAVTYRDWMPDRGQKGVRNVLDNRGEPVTAINVVVQGQPGRAATTIGRFLVNSTIGIAGIFDVASAMGMPKSKEDMGKTIGYYAGPGVEPENGGFYMVLPVIGPTNARDGVGLAIDASMDRSRSSPSRSAATSAGSPPAPATAPPPSTRSRTLFRARRPREEQRRLVRRAQERRHPATRRPDPPEARENRRQGRD